MYTQDKIKYQPIRNDDGEGGELENYSKYESDHYKIHWTIKFLFLSFVMAQGLYVVYNSEYIIIDNNNNTTNEIYNESYADKNNIEIITLDPLVSVKKSILINVPFQEEAAAIAKNTSSTPYQVTENTINYSESISNEIDVVTYRYEKPISESISNDIDVVAYRYEKPLSEINVSHQTTTAMQTTLPTDHDYIGYLVTTKVPSKVLSNQTFPSSTTTDIIISKTTNLASTTNNSGSINSDYDYTRTYDSSTFGTHIDAIEKNPSIVNSHDSQELMKSTTSTSITNYYTGKKVITDITTTPPPAPPKQWKTTTQKILLPAVITSVKNPALSSGNDMQMQRKYFINTSRCHIPFIDPLTSDVRKIFKPSHTTGCTNDKAIITKSYDEESNRYHLKINYTVAMELIENVNAETVVDDLLCCYREIERSGSGRNVDKSFKLLPCTNFHQDFIVPLHINGIIVDCTSKRTKKLVQQDAFSFIQYNPKFESKDDRSKTENTNGPNRILGLLLIGIDSLSRMNFRRNMPATFKYLTDKKWHELRGYNKVGDNTLPNLMPFLAGYTGDTTMAKCKPRTPGGFDNCNFIWTKYREHGFVTAYAEDTTTISTFNYIKAGFKTPPTDYYFRPIALAIEKTMKRKTKSGLNYCIGRRQFGEYIYDYGLEFATRYQNRSHFGLFWTNSFSHNSYDVAATMDDKMLTYLKQLEIRGILQKTMVIFFSDHGSRWGPLMKLPEGFLEERLPMFFISLPTWFQQQYPKFANNLETNQQRLATPFDIHMTMQHLLKISAPVYNITPALDCPTAQSLFYEIPENRTCDNACIPETWCTCLAYMNVKSDDKIVKKVTQLILIEMNHYFVQRNMTSICSELTLQKITRAKLRDHDISQPSAVSTYMIEFTTYPKTSPTAAFGATVDYDRKLERVTLNVEDISRRSKYENTAKCMNDKEAKKYCICKNSLKS